MTVELQQYNCMNNDGILEIYSDISDFLILLLIQMFPKIPWKTGESAYGLIELLV